MGYVKQLYEYNNVCQIKLGIHCVEGPGWGTFSTLIVIHAIFCGFQALTC